MKIMGFLASSLFLLLIGCTTPLSRPDQIVAPPLIFTVPQIDHITLSNGIRLYFKEDHELPLVNVTVMAPGGAIADPVEKVGLSTLLAKSLRTAGAGSRSADQIDRQIEQLAADFSVSADTYALTIDLSLLAADLPVGLDLLQDVLLHPAFNPDRIELARKQMIEAIRRQNDYPQAIGNRVLQRAIYGDHPLGRTPTEATVLAITDSDLSSVYEETFSPDRLWFAVSGDFDRVKLIDALEARFSTWPQQAGIRRAIPPLNAVGGGNAIFVQKDLPQSVVVMGQIGVDKSATDLHAVRVMNFILGGGGFNSRMMQEIREERGLAYSVYSHFLVGRLLPGPFIAQCETKSSTTIEALELMLASMEKIRNQPVSSEELQVAKESLNNSFVFSFNSPHEVVTQALRLDFYNYPHRYLETYRQQVEALTVADIQKAARDHLQPERMSIVLVGNEQALGEPLPQLSRSWQRRSVAENVEN